METNVLDWLEVTAAACPDKPAFLDEDGRGDLCRRAARGAHHRARAAAKLRGGRKAPIAVMSGRNAHTPAVFLGAVYAGCCYAPMDGTMPVHRLNSILHTLDTDLMIVQRAFYDKARTLEFGGKILIAEDLLEGCEDAALLADCRARARELDPLYIIFTSGSTGYAQGRHHGAALAHVLHRGLRRRDGLAQQRCARQPVAAGLHRRRARPFICRCASARRRPSSRRNFSCRRSVCSNT